jgi:hypothetical protein
MADVDAILLIERDNRSDTPLVEITISKLRLAATGTTHTLVGKIHEVGRRKDGSPVTAVALVEDKETAGAMKRAAAMARSTTETILHVLDEMAGHGVEHCDTRTLYLAMARAETWLNSNYAAYTQAITAEMTEPEKVAWKSQQVALARLIVDAAARKKNFGSTRIADKRRNEREWTWYPMVAREVLLAARDEEDGQ